MGGWVASRLPFFLLLIRGHSWRPRVGSLLVVEAVLVGELLLRAAGYSPAASF